ncbi:MAG TPA: hypothetical protein P5186_09040 [Candidatus Paceibacterota bacterium]|nr:hypothetical protein [Verrucomicrobiota bacterium]HRY48179.1 hypothetical protein [Candidatus Paceibacterota bacterium]
MKSKTILMGGCLILLVCTSTTPQVPHMIRYQSTVAVGGTNYHGIGLFKFALINAQGDQSYWSHDGTSQNGGEPRSGVEIEVNQGLYEVFLGDTTVSNMVSLSPTVFTNNPVYIRVWFSNGTMPYQAIQPDQIIPAVGYAMMSASVPDGAVTSSKLADGAVTGEKLATGAVTGASIAPASIGSSQLAPNAAAQNLQSSGGLVLSDQPHATNLTGAGLLRLGTVMAERENWSSNAVYCPSQRANPLAVWTGNELIVWGGNATENGPMLQSGGRYSMTSDTWTPISTINAPPALGNALESGAVWANTEMLVITGANGYRYSPFTDSWSQISRVNAPTFTAGTTLTWTGKELLVVGNTLPYRRHNPVTDVWSDMSSAASSNAPGPRLYHTAVWTGSELIVWGGLSSGSTLYNGGRYNPATDTWLRITNVGAPAMRSRHSAVWTGSKMIIWGGLTTISKKETASGAIYDPQTDQWRSISTNGAPSARQGHFACWTPSGMIVWGGDSSSTEKPPFFRKALNDGAVYNPATDTWAPIRNAPSEPIGGYAAVWTGSAIMIWGGGYVDPRYVTTGPSRITGPYLNKGMFYKPAVDQWNPMAFSPGGLINHCLIWTGKELIVWGGNRLGYPMSSLSTGVVNSGGRFDPIKGKWYPLSTQNAPTPRQNHQAIWTGTEMVVWGGEGMTNLPQESIFPSRTYSFLNTGGRYNPATDSWNPISTDGAPEGRADFTMVWTGHKAIVFGGRTSTRIGSPYPITALNNGALYDPVKDQWTSMIAPDPVNPRYLHTAVWTGHEMFVWGGLGVSNLTITGLPNNSGGRYDPIRNKWTWVSTVDAPNAYTNQSAIWTGVEVIVVGSPGVARQNGRYDPLADRWSALPQPSTIRAFRSQVSVWNGQELLVWGESSNTAMGLRFDPQTGAWQTMTKVGAPRPYMSTKGLWTDDAMMLYGGMLSSANLNTNLASYTLATKLYLYGKP